MIKSKAFKLQEIESDFRDQRLQAITKRNKTNRSRARAMEQRIAKELGGRRVPLSGAGSVKGDVMLNSKFGLCIAECKLSAAWNDRLDCPNIVLTASWLTKIMQEAKYMNATFGVLIFHYHGTRDDFVIVNELDFDRLKPNYLSDNKKMIVRDNKTISLDYKLVKSLLLEDNYFILSTNNGSFVVMSLDYFKDLISDYSI